MRSLEKRGRNWLKKVCDEIKERQKDCFELRE
jgi:hypothetical protein